MNDPHFRSISESCRLSRDQEYQLLNTGFVVIPDLIPAAELTALQRAYDAAMASGEGEGDDYKIGSSTTRLNDFVNRGVEFDSLYLHTPLLAASSLIIGAPFKLSSLLGRTVRPHTAAQKLHADLGQDSDAFPMVGFILMVDEFRPDNGATRFVPGSHARTESPENCLPDFRGISILKCSRADQPARSRSSTLPYGTAIQTICLTILDVLFKATLFRVVRVRVRTFLPA
jgi:hypothetical protein